MIFLAQKGPLDGADHLACFLRPMMVPKRIRATAEEVERPPARWLPSDDRSAPSGLAKVLQKGAARTAGFHEGID